MNVALSSSTSIEELQSLLVPAGRRGPTATAQGVTATVSSSSVLLPKAAYHSTAALAASGAGKGGAPEELGMRPAYSQRDSGEQVVFFNKRDGMHLRATSGKAEFGKPAPQSPPPGVPSPDRHGLIHHGSIVPAPSDTSSPRFLSQTIGTVLKLPIKLPGKTGPVPLPAWAEKAIRNADNVLESSPGPYGSSPGPYGSTGATINQPLTYGGGSISSPLQSVAEHMFQGTNSSAINNSSISGLQAMGGMMSAIHGGQGATTTASGHMGAGAAASVAQAAAAMSARYHHANVPLPSMDNVNTSPNSAARTIVPTKNRPYSLGVQGASASEVNAQYEMTQRVVGQKASVLGNIKPSPLLSPLSYAARGSPASDPDVVLMAASEGVVYYQAFAALDEDLDGWVRPGEATRFIFRHGLPFVAQGDALEAFIVAAALADQASVAKAAASGVTAETVAAAAAAGGGLDYYRFVRVMRGDLTNTFKKLALALAQIHVTTQKLARDAAEVQVEQNEAIERAALMRQRIEDAKAAAAAEHAFIMSQTGGAALSPSSGMTATAMAPSPVAANLNALSLPQQQHLQQLQQLQQDQQLYHQQQSLNTARTLTNATMTLTQQQFYPTSADEGTISAHQSWSVVPMETDRSASQASFSLGNLPQHSHNAPGPDAQSPAPQGGGPKPRPPLIKAMHAVSDDVAIGNTFDASMEKMQNAAAAKKAGAASGAHEGQMTTPGRNPDGSLASTHNNNGGSPADGANSDSKQGGAASARIEGVKLAMKGAVLFDNDAPSAAALGPVLSQHHPLPIGYTYQGATAAIPFGPNSGRYSTTVNQQDGGLGGTGGATTVTSGMTSVSPTSTYLRSSAALSPGFPGANDSTVSSLPSGVSAVNPSNSYAAGASAVHTGQVGNVMPLQTGTSVVGPPKSPRGPPPGFTPKYSLPPSGTVFGIATPSHPRAIEVRQGLRAGTLNNGNGGGTGLPAYADGTGPEEGSEEFEFSGVDDNNTDMQGGGLTSPGFGTQAQQQQQQQQQQLEGQAQQQGQETTGAIQEFGSMLSTGTADATMTGMHQSTVLDTNQNSILLDENGNPLATNAHPNAEIQFREAKMMEQQIASLKEAFMFAAEDLIQRSTTPGWATRSKVAPASTLAGVSVHSPYAALAMQRMQLAGVHVPTSPAQLQAQIQAQAKALQEQADALAAAEAKLAEERGQLNKEKKKLRREKRQHSASKEGKEGEEKEGDSSSAISSAAEDDEAGGNTTAQEEEAERRKARKQRKAERRERRRLERAVRRQQRLEQQGENGTVLSSEASISSSSSSEASSSAESEDLESKSKEESSVMLKQNSSTGGVLAGYEVFGDEDDPEARLRRLERLARKQARDELRAERDVRRARRQRDKTRKDDRANEKFGYDKYYRRKADVEKRRADAKDDALVDALQYQRIQDPDQGNTSRPGTALSAPIVVADQPQQQGRGSRPSSVRSYRQTSRPTSARSYGSNISRGASPRPGTAEDDNENKRASSPVLASRHVGGRVSPSLGLPLGLGSPAPVSDRGKSGTAAAESAIAASVRAKRASSPRSSSPRAASPRGSITGSVVDEDGGATLNSARQRTLAVANERSNLSSSPYAGSPRPDGSGASVVSGTSATSAGYGGRDSGYGPSGAKRKAPTGPPPKLPFPNGPPSTHRLPPGVGDPGGRPLNRTTAHDKAIDLGLGLGLPSKPTLPNHPAPSTNFTGTVDKTSGQVVLSPGSRESLAAATPGALVSNTVDGGYVTRTGIDGQVGKLVARADGKLHLVGGLSLPYAPAPEAFALSLTYRDPEKELARKIAEQEEEAKRKARERRRRRRQREKERAKRQAIKDAKRAKRRDQALRRKERRIRANKEDRAPSPDSSSLSSSSYTESDRDSDDSWHTGDDESIPSLISTTDEEEEMERQRADEEAEAAKDSAESGDENAIVAAEPSSASAAAAAKVAEADAAAWALKEQGRKLGPDGKPIKKPRKYRGVEHSRRAFLRSIQKRVVSIFDGVGAHDEEIADLRHEAEMPVTRGTPGKGRRRGLHTRLRDKEVTQRVLDGTADIEMLRTLRKQGLADTAEASIRDIMAEERARSRDGRNTPRAGVGRPGNFARQDDGSASVAILQQRVDGSQSPAAGSRAGSPLSPGRGAGSAIVTTVTRGGVDSAWSEDSRGIIMRTGAEDRPRHPSPGKPLTKRELAKQRREAELKKMAADGVDADGTPVIAIDEDDRFDAGPRYDDILKDYKPSESTTKRGRSPVPQRASFANLAERSREAVEKANRAGTLPKGWELTRNQKLPEEIEAEEKARKKEELHARLKADVDASIAARKAAAAGGASPAPGHDASATSPAATGSPSSPGRGRSPTVKGSSSVSPSKKKAVGSSSSPYRAPSLHSSRSPSPNKEPSLTLRDTGEKWTPAKHEHFLLRDEALRKKRAEQLAALLEAERGLRVEEIVAQEKEKLRKQREERRKARMAELGLAPPSDSKRADGEEKKEEEEEEEEKGHNGQKKYNPDGSINVFSLHPQKLQAARRLVKLLRYMRRRRLRAGFNDWCRSIWGEGVVSAHSPRIVTQAPVALVSPPRVQATMMTSLPKLPTPPPEPEVEASKPWWERDDPETKAKKEAEARAIAEAIAWEEANRPDPLKEHVGALLDASGVTTMIEESRRTALAKAADTFTDKVVGRGSKVGTDYHKAAENFTEEERQRAMTPNALRRRKAQAAVPGSDVPPLTEEEERILAEDERRQANLDEEKKEMASNEHMPAWTKVVAGHLADRDEEIAGQERVGTATSTRSQVRFSEEGEDDKPPSRASTFSLPSGAPDSRPTTVSLAQSDLPHPPTPGEGHNRPIAVGPEGPGPHLETIELLKMPADKWEKEQDLRRYAAAAKREREAARKIEVSQSAAVAAAAASAERARVTASRVAATADLMIKTRDGKDLPTIEVAKGPEPEKVSQFDSMLADQTSSFSDKDLSPSPASKLKRQGTPGRLDWKASLSDAGLGSPGSSASSSLILPGPAVLSSPGVAQITATLPLILDDDDRWMECVDDSTGVPYTYFFNIVNGESVWEMPQAKPLSPAIISVATATARLSAANAIATAMMASASSDGGGAPSQPAQSPTGPPPILRSLPCCECEATAASRFCWGCHSVHHKHIHGGGSGSGTNSPRPGSHRREKRGSSSSSSSASSAEEDAGDEDTSDAGSAASSSSDVPAPTAANASQAVFCADCYSYFHSKGKRKTHEFSVVRLPPPNARRGLVAAAGVELSAASPTNAGSPNRDASGSLFHGGSTTGAFIIDAHGSVVPAPLVPATGGSPGSNVPPFMFVTEEGRPLSPSSQAQVQATFAAQQLQAQYQQQIYAHHYQQQQQQQQQQGSVLVSQYAGLDDSDAGSTTSSSVPSQQDASVTNSNASNNIAIPGTPPRGQQSPVHAAARRAGYRSESIDTPYGPVEIMQGPAAGGLAERSDSNISVGSFERDGAASPGRSRVTSLPPGGVDLEGSSGSAGAILSGGTLDDNSLYGMTLSDVIQSGKLQSMSSSSSPFSSVAQAAGGGVSANYLGPAVVSMSSSIGSVPSISSATGGGSNVVGSSGGFASGAGGPGSPYSPPASPSLGGDAGGSRTGGLSRRGATGEKRPGSRSGLGSSSGARVRFATLAEEISPDFFENKDTSRPGTSASAKDEGKKGGLKGARAGSPSAGNRPTSSSAAATTVATPNGALSPGVTMVPTRKGTAAESPDAVAAASFSFANHAALMQNMTAEDLQAVEMRLQVSNEDPMTGLPASQMQAYHQQQQQQQQQPQLSTYVSDPRFAAALSMTQNLGGGAGGGGGGGGLSLPFKLQQPQDGVRFVSPAGSPNAGIGSLVTSGNANNISSLLSAGEAAAAAAAANDPGASGRGLLISVPSSRTLGGGDGGAATSAPPAMVITQDTPGVIPGSGALGLGAPDGPLVRLRRMEKERQERAKAAATAMGSTTLLVPGGAASDKPSLKAVASSNAEVSGIGSGQWWQGYYDSKTQAVYFYNPNTNETAWQLPEGARVIPMTPAVNQALLMANSGPKLPGL